MHRREVMHDPNECKLLLKVKPKRNPRKLSSSETETDDDYNIHQSQNKGGTQEPSTGTTVPDKDPEQTNESETSQQIESNSTLPSRDTVINHEGTCCSTPRHRLHGRTMPGRPIERRSPARQQNNDEDNRLVHPGDVIMYLSGWAPNGDETWLRATIRPMTKKLRTRYLHYYNIINEKNEEKSFELKVGGAWKIMRDNEFVDIN